ncbi:MAG: hypothetical protein GEU75_10975 [Dehalococcoidia bacterium]|nr:hypothetical protein [Dehalococcoidia bacterium]
MSQDNDNIFSILRREPEQAGLIMKAGLGGPVAIVLWDFAGGLLLPALPVAIVTLLSILIYAGVLIYLIARIVHSADRWQVESAMQARRLLTGDNRRRHDPTGETPDAAPLPQPQASFHQVYFLMRLTEEVQRARREGYEMCVFSLDLTVPGQELSPAVIEKVSFELANLASSQAKNISNSVSIGATEVVFSLPHFDKAAGKDFVSKIVQALGNYWCHAGLAVYPENATGAEALFNYARQQCEDSRQGSSRHSRTAAIA